MEKQPPAKSQEPSEKPKTEPQEAPVTAIQTATQRALAMMAELEAVKNAAIDELLSKREEIDRDLALIGYKAPRAEAVGAAGPREIRRRAPKTCSICHMVGHTVRTCPQAAQQPAQASLPATQ
jgi:hypothetical protein